MLALTLRKLRADTNTSAHIARESALNYHWIHKLRAGVIANPGASRIEKLYHYYFKLTPADAG